MISIPKCKLTISFAGKRILPPGHSVKPALELFFRKLNEVPDLNEIVLLNGLAEGADLLAAEAFCNVITVDKRKLIAVLPMPPDNYLETIENPDEKVRFEYYWNNADQQLVLKTPISSNPNLPYTIQSDYMAVHGDILLAVADTAAEIKEGGTLDTIVKCLASGKKIYCFDYVKKCWLTNPTHSKDQFEKSTIKTINLTATDL